MLPTPTPGAVFEDGVVVFDPVSWCHRTMATQSLDLLDMLRELIADGHRGRDELLAILLDSIREPGDDRCDDVTDAGRRELLDWIDLARHLYG